MRIALAALFLLFTSQSVQAHAPVCADRKTVITHLAEKYGETVVAIGIDSKGRLVEMLVSEDARTWTILSSKPGENIACALAIGGDWQKLNPKPMGTEL